MKNALALTCLLVLTACGGGDSGDGTDDGTSGTPPGEGSLCDGTATVTGCRLAWTGDVSGEAQCFPSYEPGTPAGLTMSSRTLPTAFANVYFAASPTVGTYTLADAAVVTARGGLQGIDNASSYLFYKTPPTAGELTITITSFDATGNPHGHLRGVAGLLSDGTRKVELCGQF